MRSTILHPFPPKRILSSGGFLSPMAEKIAFITGGNRGLGFQTALLFKDPEPSPISGPRL